jgi:type I restriction enzyme S subunit
MGEVAEVVGGSTPDTSRPEYFGGSIPWITPADLSGYSEKYISEGARSITEAGLANSGARMMPAGTVLFSSRAPIGYVAIAANPVCTNQGFKSFVLRAGLSPDFVYYYLQHAKKLAVGLASGTTFLEISGKKAAQIPVPIPPIDEQRAIVAEIEKQFSRLDAGMAALKRVQANLKRYRAAVLKAACEGRLVPTEAELDRGSKEATAPNGWHTARVGSICAIVDGDRGPEYPKKSDFSSDGYCLFLSAKNVRPNGFEFDSMEFISRGKHEALRA